MVGNHHIESLFSFNLYSHLYSYVLKAACPFIFSWNQILLSVNLRKRTGVAFSRASKYYFLRLGKQSIIRDFDDVTAWTKEAKDWVWLIFVTVYEVESRRQNIMLIPPSFPLCK